MRAFAILVAVTVVLAVLGVVIRALTRNAGVPSLDDPKQVTPPPARDMSQNDRA